MTTIPTWFSPVYAPADVPSLARLGLAADTLAALGLIDVRVPAPFDPAWLAGLHRDDYVDAFLTGREPLASSQGIAWSPAIRDATLAMLSGQIAASTHALETGIAMNLARGFHHAVRDRGAGYCPFNGLALVAHRMPATRVFVIDCDEHGGNGTEEFAESMSNLYTASVFGTRFGCRGGLRSWAYPVQVKRDGFAKYLRALADIDALLAEHRPDLILYQAGADCHEDDPKSQAGLSTTQMFERDLTVFRMARRHRIPIVFVVAGGYQAASKVVDLNVNTVRAAIAARGEPVGAHAPAI
jgi:acetoin utilization deacetylase AcuC-like enzyme